MPRPSKRIPTVSNESSPEAQQVIDHLRTLLSPVTQEKERSVWQTVCKTQGNLEFNYFFQHGVFFFLKSRDHPRCSHWTLSPRFSAVLRPRSIFPTAQRFSRSNHVTSGCLSPRSLFPNWSAVSHPKTRDFRFSRHFRFR